MIKNILLVGLGGAVGAMLRYGVTLVCTAAHWSTNLATFIVNSLGSLVMGILLGLLSQSPLLLLLTVGLCGGFTTFSTFSMQAATLFEQGKWGPALLYIFGTVAVCIAFAALGYWLGQKIK